MSGKPKRIPKPVHLPLGMKRLNLIELPGHIALLALDQPWLRPEHFADLGAHIRLTEELATRRNDSDMLLLIRRAKTLMQSMDGNKAEIAEFRRLIGISLPWVSIQPNAEIERAATKFLRSYEKIGA